MIIEEEVLNMVMKGKFKLYMCSREDTVDGHFAAWLEVKFKDASISYSQKFNDNGGMDKTVEFIARDKKTLKRLQKFVAPALDELKAIGEKYGVNFVISASLDKEEVPAAYQDAIKVAL